MENYNSRKKIQGCAISAFSLASNSLHLQHDNSSVSGENVDVTLNLPEAEGEITTMTKKIFLLDHSLAGRVLGPRGKIAQKLWQETGCSIFVRGKGSMRDEVEEEMNRGKPNWEHLSEDFHILIQCTDTPKIASIKLTIAVAKVKKLLVPDVNLNLPEPEGELTTMTEKIFLPNANLFGSILGYQGMNVKLLTEETGCKIYARGKGLNYDKAKEEKYWDQPFWDSQSEDPRILIWCTDTPNRASIKLDIAVKKIKKLSDTPARVPGISNPIIKQHALSQSDYGQFYLNSQQYDQNAASAAAADVTAYEIPVSNAAPRIRAQQQQYVTPASVTMFGAQFNAGKYDFSNTASNSTSQDAAFSRQAISLAGVPGISNQIVQQQALSRSDYGQFYLNSRQYDPNAASAAAADVTAYGIPVSNAAPTIQAQQQQYVTPPSVGMLGAQYNTGKYDFSNTGPMFNRRRSEIRNHPYVSKKRTS